MAFFAGVKASSFCIHLSCLVCIQSVVRGVWSRELQTECILQRKRRTDDDDDDNNNNNNNDVDTLMEP